MNKKREWNYHVSYIDSNWTIKMTRDKHSIGKKISTKKMLGWYKGKIQKDRKILILEEEKLKKNVINVISDDGLINVYCLLILSISYW